MTAPGTKPAPATGWWPKPKPQGLRLASRLQVFADDEFGVGWVVASSYGNNFAPTVAFLFTL